MPPGLTHLHNSIPACILKLPEELAWPHLWACGLGSSRKPSLTSVLGAVPARKGPPLTTYPSRQWLMTWVEHQTSLS